ncbi:MAG: universal stress protein [Candidatus Limnocylindria bacterium]|nr:universal stress protein [Candidatus Limnocylindria bacterium]
MRIVFATDGSRGALAAVDFLAALPLSCADELYIVTSPTGSESEAYAVLAECRWRFVQRAVPTMTIIRTGAAAEVVEAVAIERAAELIVVGSRGLGAVRGALLGSVARDLARNTSVPVLVVRARREAPRHMLVAVDGSTEGHAAIDLVARLPLPSAARMTLVHILAAPNDDRSSVSVVEHAHAAVGDRITDQVVVDRGHIGDEVLRQAIVSASDLIVLGARGHTQPAGLLNASVADHVLEHAHCAVLVAKAPLQPRTIEIRPRVAMAI